DEPDYGYLLDDMFYNDGDAIPASRFIVPRVEVELAFVLGKPLRGPGVTLFDVLSATDYVVPALELIDGRSQYPRKIVDNIADNAAAAGIVLGGRPVRPMDVDLRWVGALLYKNGNIEESGVSAAVLGHPAMGIAWLANKVGPFGTVLEPGHVLLAGSFTRTVAVAQGDTIHADYGPLGSISVRFT
ncbi:MAG TPA: fumarylacetoacetate hydrolase family protein, partial [Noviherbaspirillum sp.]